jgi:hypothetical protein
MAPPTMMILFFQGRCSWPFSSCLAAQIHKQLSRGFFPKEKCPKKVYGRTRIVTKFRGFLEKEVRHEFF